MVESLVDIPKTPSAAALVIGNELLTGKIREANVEVLATELFALGIRLAPGGLLSGRGGRHRGRAEPPAGRPRLAFHQRGVGPTHDDVTLEAVAAAFGGPLERSAELEGLLRGYFGGRTNEEHLRMADLPRRRRPPARARGGLAAGAGGQRLRAAGPARGLPLQNADPAPHLAGGRPWISRAFAVHADEGEIAGPLRRVAEAFPAVRIGSYPRGLEATARLALTFDGLEASLVDAAVAALSAALPDLALSAVPVRLPPVPRKRPVTAACSGRGLNKGTSDGRQAANLAYFPAYRRPAPAGRPSAALHLRAALRGDDPGRFRAATAPSAWCSR